MSMSDILNDPFDEDKAPSLVVMTTGTTPCFDCWMKDGSRQAFHYGHIIKCWFGKVNNAQAIKVFTSTDTIMITGYALTSIYDHLIRHTLISVRAHDGRYMATLNDQGNPFVTEIEIVGR